MSRYLIKKLNNSSPSRDPEIWSPILIFGAKEEVPV
jgi:hypothetical protein